MTQTYTIQAFVSSSLLALVAALPAKRGGDETISAPLAVTVTNNQDGVGLGKDVYTMYHGDGSAAAGWPAMSDWYVFIS